MLLQRDRSLLLIVDMQERLAPAINGGEDVVKRAEILAKAAQRLGVPILVSEQYPKGLGHTLDRLAPFLEGARVLAKTDFSCACDAKLAEAVGAAGRNQLVLCGMETHVCVLQTALGFLPLGYEVFIVADGVGSRRQASKDLGLVRMRDAGAAIVDSEMVIFEWLGRAGTDEFRELSRLIK